METKAGALAPSARRTAPDRLEKGLRELVEAAGASYVGASIIVDQLPEEKRRALAPCHSLVDAGELNFP